MPPKEPLELSRAEARVLGALVEKEVTTPDYYPLTLNALVNACNQRSNREPVMDLDESDRRCTGSKTSNLPGAPAPPMAESPNTSTGSAKRSISTAPKHN